MVCFALPGQAEGTQTDAATTHSGFDRCAADDCKAYIVSPYTRAYFMKAASLHQRHSHRFTLSLLSCQKFLSPCSLSLHQCDAFQRNKWRNKWTTRGYPPTGEGRVLSVVLSFIPSQQACVFPDERCISRPMLASRHKQTRSR